MEQVLAERELGRRTPEAPREYLGRLLLEQGMPERSLTTLTALFEEARFSLHPIPESAPRRALSELEKARVALAVMDEHADAPAPVTSAVAATADSVRTSGFQKRFQLGWQTEFRSGSWLYNR